MHTTRIRNKTKKSTARTVVRAAHEVLRKNSEKSTDGSPANTAFGDTFLFLQRLHRINK